MYRGKDEQSFWSVQGVVYKCLKLFIKEVRFVCTHHQTKNQANVAAIILYFLKGLYTSMHKLDLQSPILSSIEDDNTNF